jgi:hypothetical protein
LHHFWQISSKILVLFNFNFLQLLPVVRHGSSILFSPVLFMMVYDNTTRTIPLPFVHHCGFLKPQSTGNWFYFHHYINRIYCVLYTPSQTLHQHVLGIKLIYSQDNLQVFRFLIQWLQLLKQGQWDRAAHQVAACCSTVYHPILLLLFCSQCDRQRQPPENVSLWTAELNTVTSSC